MLASETRQHAREALVGKWGKAALVMLVYLLITWVISFVLNHIPVVGPIAELVIEIPISFGLVATLIKLKRGEDVSYVGFLTDGFNAFASSWKVALWTLVKLLVPYILLVVSIFLVFLGGLGAFVGASAGSIVSGISNSGLNFASGVGLTVGLLGLVGTIACSIWLTIKSYSYQLSNFILFDNPNMEAKAIVEESEKLMTGNRWKLFCLQLSFIGWAILAAFTLGIGMLWLLPYMLVAQIVFYEFLAGKKDTVVEATAEKVPVQENTIAEPTESVEPVASDDNEENQDDPIVEE